MQDFVSTGWIRMVGLVASMTVTWLLFISYGFPWVGLVWVSLAVSGALWLRLTWPRSIADVIDDVEAEPLRAVAAARPGTPRVPKAVH